MFGIVIHAVFVEDFCCKEVIGVVLVDERFGVFIRPHCQQGGRLCLVHTIVMIAVPHDAEACMHIILSIKPSVFEVFDAIKEVVSEKNVVIPGELIARLVV